VPITLIERKPGSGTRLSFDKILMNGRTESSTPASTQDSTQLVLAQLGSSPGAVSYLSAASLPKTGGPTATTIDGTAPTAANLENGSYPFYSHEHMYTKAGAAGLVTAFIDYIKSAAVQDGPVKTLGYLPLSTTTRLSAAD
jgi:phosphate transport system substrate-binding protein